LAKAIKVPSEPMRAVVADDHPVFRQGLRVLLEDLGVEVVGEASDGLEAIRISEQTRPDVVLLDLQMPGVGGIEATRRLTATMPEVRILVLTMMDDDAAVFAAIQAGALGYLLKGSGRDEIARALAAVAAGEAVYGPEVARRVRAFFTAGGGCGGQAVS
jgi:DNA-binding NarL/FixJ family response regulator